MGSRWPQATVLLPRSLIDPGLSLLENMEPLAVLFLMSFTSYFQCIFIPIGPPAQVSQLFMVCPVFRSQEIRTWSRFSVKACLSNRLPCCEQHEENASVLTQRPGRKSSQKLPPLCDIPLSGVNRALLTNAS